MCAVVRTRNLVLCPSFPYSVVCSPQPAPGSASPIFEVPWCGGCVLWRSQRQIIQIFENDSRASVPKGGTIFSKAAADGTKKKRHQKKVHFGLALLPAFFLYRSKRLYKKLYRLVVRSQPPSRNKELRFQARPKCTFWSGITKRFFLHRPKRL